MNWLKQLVSFHFNIHPRTSLVTAGGAVSVCLHHGRHHMSSSSSAPNTAPHVTRVSKMLKGSTREAKVACKSQKLMLQAGLMQVSSSGIYHMLPVGSRAQEKLVSVIDQRMRGLGCQKLSMPCLSPGMLWKATDRWTTQGSELMKLTDRNGTEYTLGPTHEEVVTNLVASQGILSHRQLPLRLYQVGRKFRDEMRPRMGWLRSREFTMKDLYTFDADEAAAMTTYHEVCDAYSGLLADLGLNYLKVLGSVGTIGGTLSHEYHLPTDIGQDTVSYCPQCRTGVNHALLLESGDEGAKVCPTCKATRQTYNAIEVGHTFFLGVKYSQVFMAQYKTSTGKTQLLEMGCYGLGVTRLLAACIEVLSSSEDECIHWPALIAPYQLCILPPKFMRVGRPDANEEAGSEIALNLYHKIQQIPNLRNEVVYDDRPEITVGKRVLDAKKLGYPYIIIVAKRALEDPPIFEVEDTHNGETSFLSEDALMDLLSRISTVPVNIL